MNLFPHCGDVQNLWSMEQGKLLQKSNLQIIQFKTDIFWDYLSEKMNVKL